MSLKFTQLEIPEVILVEPLVHRDARGLFYESYHKEKYQAGGIVPLFLQDNLSYSVKNTLRGLHYQLRKPQAKLLTCLEGKIFDVVVDIRKGSPSFGKWISVILSGKNKKQLFIPEGFAHGFCVLSSSALVHYKCTGYYDPKDEKGALWSDPEIGIQWPLDHLILSEKDKTLPLLHESIQD